MAQALAVGDILEFNVMGVALGQAVDNVIHYRVASPIVGAPTMTTALVATTSLRSIWRANILPLLHESYFVLGYSLQKVVRVFAVSAKARLEYSDFIVVGGVVGTDAGAVATDGLPTNAAAAVYKSTQANTPRLKGGMRLGPLAKAQVQPDPNQNLLVDATRASITAAAETMRIPGVTDGTNDAFLQMVILSKFLNKSVRSATPPYSQDVAQVSTNQYVSTQKSRQPRRNAL